jgi:4-oxalocrotonate tautomerase family enzyme
MVRRRRKTAIASKPLKFLVSLLLSFQAVVKVLTGTGSDEQKARMIEQTTDVLRRVLGNPPMPFYVTFEEIPSTSWGYDGRTVAEITKARLAG